MGNPLRLLIVEDETSIRNLLRLMLDWEALGVRIVGEASTGAEALQLMEEHLPDIVLTDIEMPYMDGLELSERVLERYQDVTVLILTAHDHFAYAQQALRAGVSNYLLKPLDKDKLRQAIEETVGRIRSSRALLSEMETSYHYIRSHVHFFRDRILEDLIHTGAAEGLSNILEMVGVRFGPLSRYTLALMNIAGNGASSFSSEKYLILNNCRAYIEENYAVNGRLYVFVDGLEYLALLSHDAETDLPGVCRRIAEVLGESLGRRIYCGVSDPCPDLGSLAFAYAQARDALRLSIISEEGVVYARAGQVLAALSRHSAEDQMQDLLLFIKSGMPSHAMPLAADLLQRAVSSRDSDLNAAKMLAFQILSQATSVLTGQNVPWLTLVELVSPSYARLLDKNTFPEVEKLLLEQICALCTLAENHNRQESHEIVSKVIHDLEENYGDAQISMALMAGKYAVNSSYLSRIFKSYTGKSFSEYLMELRVQKAKSILEKGTLKAYQLAQLTGIPDPNYFTKCFKRITGVSFQTYKAEFMKK